MCPVLPCAPFWQGCGWEKCLGCPHFGWTQPHGPYDPLRWVYWGWGAAPSSNRCPWGWAGAASPWSGFLGAQIWLCQHLTPCLNLHCCIPRVATVKKQPKPRCIGAPVLTPQLPRMQQGGAMGWFHRLRMKEGWIVRMKSPETLPFGATNEESQPSPQLANQSAP